MGKLAASALASLLLAACAAPVELSDQHRRSLKAVQLASTVSIPDAPRVHASDSAAGMFFFGPIGMAVAAASSDQPRQFKDSLAFRKIDVREIVRSEFVRQGTSAPRFPAIVERDGDAMVQLDIEDYGLGPGFSLNPFEKPLSAMLRVSARMTGPDGKVLWQKVEYVTNMNAETESHKFEAWLGERAIAERGFRKAAEIVVAALLQEFQAEPQPAQAGADGRPRTITPIFGPDSERLQRGHDTGGNVRFESEGGGDGRCSSYAACGNREPQQVNMPRR